MSPACALSRQEDPSEASVCCYTFISREGALKEAQITLARSISMLLCECLVAAVLAKET